MKCGYKLKKQILLKALLAKRYYFTKDVIVIPQCTIIVMIKVKYYNTE